jgi:hypothetical protein
MVPLTWSSFLQDIMPSNILELVIRLVARVTTMAMKTTIAMAKLGGLLPQS